MREGRKEGGKRKRSKTLSKSWREPAPCLLSWELGKGYMQSRWTWCTMTPPYHPGCRGLSPHPHPHHLLQVSTPYKQLILDFCQTMSEHVGGINLHHQFRMWEPCAFPYIKAALKCGWAPVTIAERLYPKGGSGEDLIRGMRPWREKETAVGEPQCFPSSANAWNCRHRHLWESE